jgi:hypothetical protein
LHKKAGRLFLSKTQVTGADLDHLSPNAQPGEGKLGIGARGEHQVQGGRHMIEQEEESMVDGLIFDHVIVIQDEDDFSICLQNLIEQGRKDGRERGSLS